ncbi:MAG: protein translocase subunit SecD [Cyanobacteria bacterium P01_H01_bin.74]
MKNQKWILLFIIALSLVAMGIIVSHKDTLQLGLDLKGGTRLTLEAQPTADVKKITPVVMESLQSVIERRVNSLGIGESVVQRTGQSRLIVEIPGVKSPEEAKKRLGRVGKLEFKTFQVNPDFSQSSAIKPLDAEPVPPEPQYLWQNTGLSGKDFQKADISTKQNGDWVVAFQLTSAGAKKFAELTQKLAPKRERLGIFFDDLQVSAPVVNEPILDGNGMIEGNFTKETAKDLVNTLNAGALPVDIEIIEENTVGPLLGQASIKQSLFAGLLGLSLVLVFMAVYYRLMGLIAGAALLVYSALTIAAFILVGVTFTLAGIAGFILSIGMAVDANILIFERTKEELRDGRKHWKAIEVGFDRAFPSIFDSNMTTIITCALLWIMGTGPVKGFALTLAIGVGISMFSAITVTRTFLYAANTQITEKKPLPAT